MPAPGLYSTKEVQNKLMYGIQDVIVKVSEKAFVSNSVIGTFVLMLDFLKVAYRLKKLGIPTYETSTL